MSGEALGINDYGQAVGYSQGGDFAQTATEWSDGIAIGLGSLPGSSGGQAIAINDAGLAVGYSVPDVNIYPVPEPSTWAMMLIGFAGLGYAGYRRSQRVLGQNARLSIY